ncbi:MAG: hypothetical protein AB3X44_21300 [Leptothrix sp. (in: b-proteobacteria)]
MPHIAVMNESSLISDYEVQDMLPAFSQQWNQDLSPVWGLEAATFEFVPANTPATPGTWWLVFLDQSDHARALAYHDLTNDKQPLAKVFVKSLREANELVSVGATHELCEMGVDPWLTGAYQDANGVYWAAEICDPVQGDQYGYLIDLVRVSDFVTPAWFGLNGGQGAVDLKGHATLPFEVLSGGYIQKLDPQRGWVQINGAMTQVNTRVVASHGSRRERRWRGATGWLQSDVVRHRR